MGKVKRLLISAGLTFLAIGTLVWAVASLPKFVLLSSIECTSQFGPCGDDLNQYLAEYKKQPIFDAKGKLSAELSNNPSISKFAVRVKLPDKLDVSVIQKKAVYGILGPHGDTALADSSGKILSYKEDSLLPHLKIQSQPPSVGENVDDQTMFGLKLLSYMNSIYQTREGSLDDNGVYFELKNGPKIVFPSDGEAKELVGGVVLIINELNKQQHESRMKEGQDLSNCGSACTVDLRFRNPVVRL